MAILATNTQMAEVQAVEEAMDATVNFNGALIDMLATTYVFILMAAIREAIQNGCDAAKRAGLSFADGVMVLLPTPSNPMITIIDKGDGMTKEFMKTTYLSMGSSTKTGDNGSAGGLGVGRWAAYGYIREAYITTCHASDMVERTYFQYQGPESKPKVRPAGEAPGTAAGTKVNFPVKESDLAEALRAVAWLKEVMQLTMGESFSVDNPALLPTMLPEFNGTVIDLETADEGLKGVLVYPMKGNTLKYGRQGVQPGSLVVLTNKAAGVGGLPFHVQSPTNTESVFQDGMVVEIPMSFQIPFMPSREEIKYTDEVNELLLRIDAAAAKAIVLKAEELFMSPTFHTKAELSNLLGNNETWHWFARGTRAEGVLKAPLAEVTGNKSWNGIMTIPAVPEMEKFTVSFKSTASWDTVLREGHIYGHVVCIRDGNNYPSVTFTPDTPIAVVVNDLKGGGTVRFRHWLRAFDGKQRFIYMTAEDPADAIKAGEALNAAFGNALKLYKTSTMPMVVRSVVGRTVVGTRSRTTTSQLTFYSKSESKQVTDTAGFATYTSAEPVRVWLGKDGGTLAGFSSSALLANLTVWGDGNLDAILDALKLKRLYLLTPKQQSDLSKAQASIQAEGLWDLADDEFDDDEDGQDTMRAVKALKSWKPFEEALADLLERPDIRKLLAGKKVREVKDDWEFTQFCVAIARQPRMELTGSSFDKMVAPHLDLLSGEVKLYKAAELKNDFHKLCAGLKLVGKNLQEQPGDSDSRKELIASLNRLTELGHIDYALVFKELKGKFPILETVGKLNAVSPTAVDDLCRAMSVVYR